MQADYIRKFVLTSRLHELVDLGSRNGQAAAFLSASVRAGLNILIAGGTQAGKTTLHKSVNGHVLIWMWDRARARTAA